MARRRRFALIAALSAAWLVGSLCAQAEVRLNGMFVDGAVLQRGMRIPVWGAARDGEKVTVTLNGKAASTVASGGRWSVRLPAMTAGGPYTLVAAGDNRVEVKNVLIGEVWICGGQSNMQFGLISAHNGPEAVARSSDPQLRLCDIPRRGADEPQTDVKTEWHECSPNTVRNFTAVGYFFGRDLRRALNVPVGLISSNLAATPAQAWTRRSTLEADPDLRAYVGQYERALAAYPKALMDHATAMRTYRETAAAAAAAGQPAPKAPGAPGDPRSMYSMPYSLHNAMIAPLQPYAIRGAIWYQGESNAGQAWLYRNLFPTMIRDWRAGWDEGDFTFLFVQLAPFMKIEAEPKDSAWAELREAQLLTTRTCPKTGMAVITDVGEENDIHPRHKEPVGARLALLARRIAYGEKLVAQGPVVSGYKFIGNKAIIWFNEVGSGLVAKGGPLTGFAIAGADRHFVFAGATIQSDTVVVSSPSVPMPVAVRFGWANYPVVNLFNSEGIPASPFRTDDFPMVTAPKAPAR